jgi:hypothetical protein
MSMTKLILRKDNLFLGNILRCSGKLPFEKTVDFMVSEYLCNGEQHYGLMTISGYKAGRFYVIFPKDSTSEKACAINYDWLVENWDKWGYFDCPLEDVYFIEGLTPVIYDES